MSPLSLGRGCLAAAAALAFSATGTARADEILVYQRFDSDPQGGDTAGPNASTVLQGLGHDVTLVASFSPTLPADLSAFDSIYVIQLPTFTGVETAAFIGYVRAGGGLYLSGENSCCELQNASVSNVTGQLLRSPIPTIGQTVEMGGNLFTATAADPFGLTSNPNAIAEWVTVAAGIVSNVPPARAVFAKADGDVGAAAYGPEHLTRGSGCVYVAMDHSYWQPIAPDQMNLPKLAENIQRFLGTCGDSDGDGLSDEAEALHGTKPNDPDTDGDGLCDGYATVPGVCIDGEHPLDDEDEDGIIPPLDLDDDDDGIPTAIEVAAEGQVPDADGDRIPAWIDLDSDGNFILDRIEGTADGDGDGIPAFIDQGDDPIPCATDHACGPEDSGLVCDLEIDDGFCVPGCQSDGNGCPTGQTCTSTDDTIGECVPDGGGGTGGTGTGGGGGGGGTGAGGGGAGDGGSGGGGTSGTAGSGGTGTATGGSSTGTGGTNTSSGGTSSSAGGAASSGTDPETDSGCNCVTTPNGSSWGALATVAALGLLRRRRARD